jgi:hypothetical protein
LSGARLWPPVKNPLEHRHAVTIPACALEYAARPGWWL